MRHGKRFNHLGRTSPHRKATLSNLASSLLLHKRINTTLAKAKALRQYVEPLITKAKNDNTHTRRVVFSYLQNKESLKALYNEVVDRIGDRPGGYTRIIKLGTRLGDSAEMAMIELVDFNDLLIEESKSTKTKTRRSRRGGKKTSSDDAETGREASGKKKEEKSGKSEPHAKAVDKVEEKISDGGDIEDGQIEDTMQADSSSGEESGDQESKQVVSKTETEEVDKTEEVKAKTSQEMEETDEKPEKEEEDKEENKE